MRTKWFSVGWARLGVAAAALAVCLALAAPARALRIKDIARLQGVRSNQLFGTGIVVGLHDTGDQDLEITSQMMKSMLDRMNIRVSQTDLASGNVAAVMVTAELPPFIQPGDTIDVTVSSIGDAKSLEGGTLILTPLMAANGNVYAVAQGHISTGGFSRQAGGGAQQVNFPTVARIPNGATVERSVETGFMSSQFVRIILNKPDFTTAARVMEAINARHTDDFGIGLASALDASTIEVFVPDAMVNSIVQFISAIENITVEPDAKAKIVVNERTGTVVLGGNITIGPAAVAHGSLQVTIRSQVEVSQPEPWTEGETMAVTQTEIEVREEKINFIPITADDVVKGLNQLGVTPRDIIAILQALKVSGALQAEIEIM